MRSFCLILAALTFHTASANAARPILPSTRLPVREVTAFKDGHAYVLREEPLAVADGQVVLDQLPAPVLGTFWPFATGGAKVVSAVAGKSKVTEWVEALDFPQLIEANLGKNATIYLKPAGHESTGEIVTGKLLDVPKRTEDGVAQAGGLFLLDVRNDTRAIPFDSVRSVLVSGVTEKRVQHEVEKDRLTLRIEGSGPDARVGVVYVQKGLRWIPAYKVDVDGAGKARVQMEATLVNDLIDLSDVTVNLVIGVPTFTFKEHTDPIALQQEIADVSAARRYDPYGRIQLSNALSNSIMSQTASFGSGGPAQALAPEVDPAGVSAEDLFVFTVYHVTLAKGERMVLPITSFDLEYRDVYRLDVPLDPPSEANLNLNDESTLELMRQQSEPRAKHVLRLKNTSQSPFTTAPALILANGRVLAQGRMTYAPPGIDVDLEATTAVDIGVQVTTDETRRTPEFRGPDGRTYVRLDMRGGIELRNSKRERVELEVRRHVLGQIDAIDQDGTKRQMDLPGFWRLDVLPIWTRWWYFPWWWSHVNGFGELRWKVALEPGATTKLEARWHYLWQ